MTDSFRTISDALLTNLLLVCLGLAVSEFAIRQLGYQAWTVYTSETPIESLFEQDSKIGWVLRPRDRSITFTGNSNHSETVLANRTRLVVPGPTSLDGRKLIVLGDSSIFGWGISDEETLASQIALKIPQMQVINGAVPGYGTLQSTLMMNRITGKVKPTHVLLGYAEYYLPRDSGALSWGRTLSEISIRNNINLPYAVIRQGELEIISAQPFFFELPFRHTFATVRLIEESMKAFEISQEKSSQIDVAKELFRRWAQEVKALRAAPIVFFWDKDDSEKIFGEFLRNIGVLVPDCRHPQQGSSETVISNDGHPSYDAVKYWAECLTPIF